MWNKVMIAFGVAFGTALAAALGVDIYEHRQVSKKVGLSVKDLKEASVKEIQQGIVTQAVKAAAQESVDGYIRTVRNDVMAEARDKIGVEVKKAVEASEAVTQKEVLDKISLEASKIDMAELKRSARDKAEAKILEKFDGNLEDLLQKFNENLSNVQKIYGGIADAISKGQERDKSIKFSLG